MKDPGNEAARLEFSEARRPAAMKPVACQPDGSGAVPVSGELRQWHQATVELAVAFSAESDFAPNPFTVPRQDLTFTHEAGTPRYVAPGFFAAAGTSANLSATAGTIWRAHLSPRQGWQVELPRVDVTKGPQISINGGGAPFAPFDGKSGTFAVIPTDKTGDDFSAQGRLTGGAKVKLTAPDIDDWPAVVRCP